MSLILVSSIFPEIYLIFKSNHKVFQLCYFFQLFSFYDLEFVYCLSCDHQFFLAFFKCDSQFILVFLHLLYEYFLVVKPLLQNSRFFPFPSELELSNNLIIGLIVGVGLVEMAVIVTKFGLMKLVGVWVVVRSIRVRRGVTVLREVGFVIMECR